MNLRLTLANLFPDGSQQGECGFFVRSSLAEILPLGNSYSDKKKSVDIHGIRATQLEGNFRIGDVLVTSEGTNWYGGGYGHVAFINNIVGNTLYLTESNFNLDKRVHHHRTLPKNSPKIYGVIRKPFLFEFPTTPINLKITVLMNHEKQWNGKAFEELRNYLFKLSDGKIVASFYPLYTYKALKNWWYRTEGDGFGNWFNVIDRGYVEEQAMPFLYPDNHFLLWCITKKQWQGSVFDKPGTQELGWYYNRSKFATIACDENDKSFLYPDMSAFAHYGAHEICHFLEEYGNRRGLKMTDKFDLQDRNLGQVFNNIEWDYLAANL